jgi:hypothetical protein
LHSDTSGEIGTEHVAAILTIALILVLAVFVFAGISGSNTRMVCHAWKIRADGAFEAETNSGSILFRREDIQLIEPHEGKDANAWVCIGNLQRMVWIAY